MMSGFIIGFWLLLLICGLLFWYTRQTIPSVGDANFRKFQRTYLVVYLFATAADWLQGPYVYALYDHYGMSQYDIEILFVAGFGSSMLVGTFVGSVADKYGRRANCVLYGILYGLACITKHFNNFWILMLGRLLGGTATSILYSAFESWLICEHNKRGFDQDLLSTIFSHAVLGNSVVAIFSGVIAQQCADVFGYVSPFDLSLVMLIIMTIITMVTWSENHGDRTGDVSKSFKDAIHAIKSDHKILCLGLIQALFEGAMYTFVLEWTPALTPPKPVVPAAGSVTDEGNDGHRGTIPHGYIFAAFMVAIMIGSSLFKILNKHIAVESFMRFVLLAAALSLLTPVLFPFNQPVIFCGFLVFEACVGIFWPSLSTMRGKYVPEETRATIMNFFRVPLNLIVVVILVQDMNMSVIFVCCFVFLILSTISQQWLFMLKSNVVKMDKARTNDRARLMGEEEEEA
ncbi:molybdate-anion transporter-like [Lineus longissimus]|uniref:molybdate-anion transporter-like n=1 Tax=Lineus longissimus TaxID=88925 RepID=UPI002B4DA20A